MRTFPALRVRWSASDDTAPDRIMAELDPYRPVAVEEVDGGLRVFFTCADDRDAARNTLAQQPDCVSLPEDVPDDGWAERSQATLTPVAAGRITVTPPWADTPQLRAAAPGPVIVIYPSMGFGTGHHATTRLCLDLLQRIDLRRRRVLDIGTGSAVLAIAAAALDARQVTAMDLDPDALANARQNLALNGSPPIALLERDVSALNESHDLPRFDVIVANLTAALLIRQARAITARAAPAAVLIASGFEGHEAADVTAAFERRGWVLETRADEDSWVGIACRRPPPVPARGA